MSEIPINFLVNVFHGGVRGGGALKSVLIKSNKVNCAAYRLALLKHTHIYRVSHTHIQGARKYTRAALAMPMCSLQVAFIADFCCILRTFCATAAAAEIFIIYAAYPQ